MRVCFLILLACLCSTLYADNVIYSSLPPTDVSLTYTPTPAPIIIKHHHHYYHRHHRNHHRISMHYKPKHLVAHKYRKHVKHNRGSLLVYYDLPATACCGPTCQLKHARCCAQEGAWDSSYYGTFRPTDKDLISSATNDDDLRPYDMYAYPYLTGKLK